MANSELLVPGDRRPIRVTTADMGGTMARLEVVNDAQPETNGSDGRELAEYWQTLKQRKWTILLGSVLCGLVGFLIGLTETPMYRAATTVELQDFNERFLNISEVTATGTNYPFESHMATQIQVLTSNAMVERVVNKLQLDKRPEFAAPPPDPENPDAAANWDPKRVARNMTRAAIEVAPYGGSRILEIAMVWPEPEFASEFVNGLAGEYKAQVMESRWQATTDTTEWLEKQLQDLKEKVRESEVELQRYADETGLMFTSNRDSVSEEKLRQLQAELSGAQADRVAKQSQYETALEQPADTLPTVATDGSLGSYQMRLTDLKRELAQLQISFKPTYPLVQQVQAQIAEMESALEQGKTRIVARIKNEYEAALTRERLLSQAYASQSRLVTDQSGKSIQYRLLQQELDSNRNLYDTMLQRLREAGIASAMRASTVSVLDVAEPPRMPFQPNIPLNVALGSFAGLFLGAIVALVRDSTDRSLRRPGDVSRWLRLPELGVIPRREAVPAGPGPNQLAGPVRLLSGGNRTNGTETNGNYRKHWSPLAEYFRVTLTSILFADPEGNRPQVMVVTSPGPGEGKSSVASNLAITLAEIGKRVLIVDADMRRPRLHEIFNLPNTWGLSDLLKGEIPIESCPLEAIARSAFIPGLYVLPSGPGPRSIARLLYSDTGQRLLKRLREEFDTVLIDTPPMLQISDARVIGRLTDGVILVLKAGSTTRDSGNAAKERLQADGTPILGTVLNHWNPKVNGYGGYDSYDAYARYYKPGVTA